MVFGAAPHNSFTSSPFSAAHGHQSREPGAISAMTARREGRCRRGGGLDDCTKRAAAPAKISSEMRMHWLCRRASDEAGAPVTRQHSLVELGTPPDDSAPRAAALAVVVSYAE